VPLVEGGTELIAPEVAAAAALASAAANAGGGLAYKVVSSYMGLRAVPWWVWLGILYLLFGGRRR